MKKLLVVLFLFGLSGQVSAADVKAGAHKASLCAGCHGTNGVSVSADVPNLAAQKADYLKAQLKAFRAGTRKNPYMNVIAPQLSEEDVDNLIAYFSSLPGASAGAASQIPEAINQTHVKFPANYKNEFKLYTTVNFADKKEVRLYYANDAALKAAGAGKRLPDGSVLFVEVFKAKLDAYQNPVKDKDGNLEPGELQFYTAMAMEKGWGKGFPKELRNGDWNYAVFKTDQSPRPGFNQAKCLACHKPLDKVSYVFTLEPLAAKASQMK
jgi:cytochrome c553